LVRAITKSIWQALSSRADLDVRALIDCCRDILGRGCELWSELYGDGESMIEYEFEQKIRVDLSGVKSRWFD
jgi:hypothetical protein